MLATESRFVLEECASRGLTETGRIALFEPRSLKEAKMRVRFVLGLVVMVGALALPATVQAQFFFDNFDSYANAFADVPGLVSKVWLSDPDTNSK